MKKVLVLSDFVCTTGFANVSRNILEQLNKTGEYEFDVVAINYFGDPHEFPYKIYPAMVPYRFDDRYGRERALDMLMDGKYDIFFVIQDTFHFIQIGDVIKKMQEELKKRDMKVFKYIHYFPVDGWQPDEWTTKVVNNIEIPVTYTNYASKEINKVNPKLKLDVVYHGTNLKEFYPVDVKTKKSFRHDFFHGLADGKFLITNVNTNWLRKDIPRTLEIFSKFKILNPDSFL